MNEICSDNRFKIIDKAKKHLLEATNIESSSEEMKVLDSFLFRCWQMGWLKIYDTVPFSNENYEDIDIFCLRTNLDRSKFTLSKKYPGKWDYSGEVNLNNYKEKTFLISFGVVSGNFNCSHCENLISLKGSPKEVNDNFSCFNCDKKITKEKIRAICIVKGAIDI